MNTIKNFLSNKRTLRTTVLLSTLLGIVLIVGIVYADIPNRVGVRGTVPNPGTQQQELANITFPAPYNVFEFNVTCVACHGGTVDQNAGHGGNWAGSNMASAGRDPVFRANQIIVNNAIQAATGENGAGNMCFRCHSPNGWYSGRFDPSLGGDPEGRTMMHSILLSTDDEGILCEFCHRTMGNVDYKRADLNPGDPVWNMMAGVSDWPHSGQPYVDQDGSPTIADGNPYGDTTLQLIDGMTYNARYPGTVDVYVDDIPLVPDGGGGYLTDPLGLYTGQTYGIYPPGWIDPMGNDVGGQPVINPDGSLPINYDVPIGPPLNPNGTPCYNCQSMSLEHPTTFNGFVSGPMTSQDSRLCGSCHDLTVPVLNHGMPEQRTYTEWKFSAFGRVGADFRNCQDCHMPRLQHEYADTTPSTLNVDPVLSGWFPYAKNRVNTAFHKLVGANRDLPMMMKELYPEVDLEVIGAPTGNDTRIFPGMLSDRSTNWNRSQRNTEISLLDGVDVEIVSGPTWNGTTQKWEMQVKVTNQTGHRIPSGYPDGRRFWIDVEVTDQNGAVVYQSGAYDDATATLSTAPGVPFNRALGTTIDSASNAVMVYERVTGVCAQDPNTGELTGCTPSPNLLNDTILFDNRIPPMGFDYAAYQNAGVKFWNYDPLTFIPSEEPARYPGGQNWDLVTYTFTGPLPPAQLNARAELYWQTHTREFMEHLKTSDTSTVRPEGPPDIFDPNYPLNPSYLSDVIGLSTITDLDGNPLNDNWGGIAFASWLLTGKGAPYLVGADDTTAVAPPAAPTGVAGAPLDPFTNEVTWDAVTGADGYLVWVKYGLGDTTASWDKLGIVYDDGDLATPLLIKQEGLNVAKSYQYKVQAFNGAGFSADSAIITVSTPIDLPLPPENLQMVSSTATSIFMSWFDGADNETDFVIQRQPVPPLSPFVTVATIPSQTPGGPTGGNNWTDTGLIPGACYNYQVAASNASGMSTWNINGPVQMCTQGPPTGPITLSATIVSGEEVNLAWTSANGIVQGYRLERSLDGTTFAVLTTMPANVIAFSDTTVSPNTTYWYRVFAFNAAGDSPASNVVSVTTTAAPPAAPSNLVATASAPSPLPPTVTLTWTDNANDETGFNLERAPDANGAPGIYAVIATLAPNTTSYVDDTVEPKMTYWYRVQAFSAAGPSFYSNEASGVTPGQIPEAPSELRVSDVKKDSIRIRWLDNATNEVGYYVERSTDGGLTWVLYATLPANSTTYNNRQLPRNTTFCYRVQAFNADGVSAFAGPVCATTKR